jgi:uncharacterized protein YciU (UPF0263 family)
LIEFSLKYNNRELFELLTGEDWRDHIVKDIGKEKYNDKYNQNELHKDEDILIVFDTVNTLIDISVNERDLSL